MDLRNTITMLNYLPFLRKWFQFEISSNISCLSNTQTEMIFVNKKQSRFTEKLVRRRRKIKPQYLSFGIYWKILTANKVNKANNSNL